MTADPDAVSVRAARIDDLPRLTEIYNHYIVHTPITFDLAPYTVEQRREWFGKFHDHGRHRLLVADAAGDVAGFAGTAQFRTKAAYDTTVEVTVYCAPESIGRGIGSALYTALFDALPMTRRSRCTSVSASCARDTFTRSDASSASTGTSAGTSGRCDS